MLIVGNHYLLADAGIRLAGRFRAGRMRGADKGGMREVQMM